MSEKKFQGFNADSSSIDDLKTRLSIQKIEKMSKLIGEDIDTLFAKINAINSMDITKIAMPERIVLTANGNLVPTINAGSSWRFYVTKDNCIPFSLSADKTGIAFDTAIAASTVYYAYVTYNGIYGCGTSANIVPTYSYLLRGWYSSDFKKRLLIEFTTDGASAITAVSIKSMDETSEKLLIINETQAASTAGGTFTSGADRTRVINTVLYNSIPTATLVANQFALPIGKYIIDGSAVGVLPILHQAWLYNVGLTTKPVIGTSESANYNRGSNRSILNGPFSVTDTASSKNLFEIRHRAGTTSNTIGLGEACNLGTSEVYTTIAIKLIGY